MFCLVDGTTCIFYSEFVITTSAFFVTVRAGTAYRKIWRLVNSFFAHIIRFTVQKFQLFWGIFCRPPIIIFFIELWHILILWLAKMPNGGMPVFTLIATGWRHWRTVPPCTVVRPPIKNQNMRTGKYSFTKKALIATNNFLYPEYICCLDYVLVLILHLFDDVQYSNWSF